MGDLRLIADIGGTNARFALVRPGERTFEPFILPVASSPTFDTALETVITALEIDPSSIGSCAIAAAGPVNDGRIKLTNAPWTIAADAVSRRLGNAPVRLFNDLEAVALALPFLAEGEALPLKPGNAAARAPMIALNVGTGFGAAVCLPSATGWHALATEPGHMTLPGAPPWPGAETVEDVLSGPGLARLRADQPDHAKRIFSTLLGDACRNLILATGSWGGVYFCGGVMDGWQQTVDDTAFRDAFDRPGAMADRLGKVPLHRIMHKTPALLGLSHATIA